MILGWAYTIIPSLLLINSKAIAHRKLRNIISDRNSINSRFLIMPARFSSKMFPKAITTELPIATPASSTGEATAIISLCVIKVVSNTTSPK